MKKTTKFLRRLAALLLAVLLAAGTVSALAEDALMGSKKASPTELTPDNRDTTVTLSLPSEEYKNKVDVMFVMDNSNSLGNSGVKVADLAMPIFDSLVADYPDIELKVGVVKFKGAATDMLDGLKLYDDSSASTIRAAIDNTSVPGSGSNVHSGLIMADRLLQADTEVDDAQKYVILVTDGRSYIWNNDDDVPTTYYSQSLQSNSVTSSGKAILNQTSGSFQKENGPMYCVFTANNYTGGLSAHDFYIYSPINADESTAVNGNSKDYYQWLFDLDTDELKSTNTKYDFQCFYATTGISIVEGSVATITPTNAATVFTNNTLRTRYGKYYDFTPSGSFADMKYLSVSPYNIKPDGEGGYLFDTSSHNEDFFLLHPDCMQKGVWLAGHYWDEHYVGKYKTAAICQDSSGGRGRNIAASFAHWLEDTADYGASSAEKNVTEQIEQLFSDIDSSIRYLVASGTVEDKIAADFTLKESDAPFIIKVGGETLTVTKTGDHSWGFGEQLPVEGDGEAKYPYEISYDPDTKIITWVINVPVEIAHPVTLSYDLTLREDADPGVYDTNEYAVLDFESTDGEKGQFTFPIPQVTYKKSTPTPKPPTPPTNDFLMYFYKEWPDGEPTDIYFTLYRPDGTVYKHAFNKKTVSANKFRYEAWLSTDAEYFVIETAMPGYSTTYKNTGKYADVTDRCYKGGTIVNSKVPVTGDSFSPIMWTVTAAASLMGTAVLILKKRRA